MNKQNYRNLKPIMKEMTIDKASEVLRNYKMESAFEATPDFEAALQLGIEALKRVEDARRPDPLYPDTPLPGETPGGNKVEGE